MIRLSPGVLGRRHTVVHTLTVEHLTAADDVRPHAATIVKQQFAVGVSAGVVEDETLPLVLATVEQPTFTISAAL